MATKDLEKYYKVLDRYTKLVLPAQPAVTVSTQTSGSQSHHALPQAEDGRDQQDHKGAVDQDVPRWRCLVTNSSLQ